MDKKRQTRWAFRNLDGRTCIPYEVVHMHTSEDSMSYWHFPNDDECFTTPSSWLCMSREAAKVTAMMECEQDIAASQRLLNRLAAF